MPFDNEQHRKHMGALATKNSIRQTVLEELNKCLDAFGDELDSMTEEEILLHFTGWIESQYLKGYWEEC